MKRKEMATMDGKEQQTIPKKSKISSLYEELQRQGGLGRTVTMPNGDMYVLDSLPSVRGVILGSQVREWLRFPYQLGVCIRELNFFEKLDRKTYKMFDIYNAQKDTFWETLAQETKDAAFQPWPIQTCRAGGRYFFPRQGQLWGDPRRDPMQLGLVLDFHQGTVRCVEENDGVCFDLVDPTNRTENDRLCRFQTTVDGRISQVECCPQVQQLMDQWWRPSPELIVLVLDCILTNPQTQVSIQRLATELEPALNKLKEMKSYALYIVRVLVEKLLTPPDRRDPHDEWEIIRGVEPQLVDLGIPSRCIPPWLQSPIRSMAKPPKDGEFDTWVNQNWKLKDFPMDHRCDLLVWFLDQRMRLRAETEAIEVLPSFFSRPLVQVVFCYL